MPTDLTALLPPAALRTVFQPLVDLADRAVVGYEALCRGPAGSALESPDHLFRAAARLGLTAELDWAARCAAIDAALAGLAPGATLFVNAEPEALVTAAPAPFAGLRRRAHDAGLAIVLEITERALTADPAALLAAVARVRDWGWGVAVDDVGADRASLALLPFLAPDVIKLDLRLVQDRTTVDLAEIVNAVRAQAERTGGLLLAEGIETEAHADLARAMGAQYGQGWLFGRPGPLPAVGDRPAAGVLRLPGCRPPAGPAQPADATHTRLPVHRATKPLLIAISKTLERHALAGGEAAVVLGTFQQARFFTAGTAARYATLARSAAFVAALATDLPAAPAPGVRGTHLPADDPLTAEWDIAVVGPHFAAALVARDLGDVGPDAQRRFDYTLTYDRDTAVAVAGTLMRRVGHPVADVGHRPAAALPGPVQPASLDSQPSSPSPAPTPTSSGTAVGTAQPLEATLVAGVRPGTRAVPRLTVPAGADLDRLLRRAVAATDAGITIVDARALDCPLVFANAAFERLSGFRLAELVGRNCRLLQHPRTDPGAVRMLREQIRSGREVSTVLLNARPDGSTWWNELAISPVHAPDGTVTHFIGVQTDVSLRVEAERRLAYLAHHDELTGLTNRTGFYSSLEELMARGRRHHRRTGLLYVDLDGFKRVNDEHGHAAGDRLLVAAAGALRHVARPGDMVARLGGDEFAVVLADLDAADPAAADLTVTQVASRLATAVEALDAHGLPLRASIGTAVHPDDADDGEALLLHADRAMYEDKASRRLADALRAPAAPTSAAAPTGPPTGPSTGPPAGPCATSDVPAAAARGEALPQRRDDSPDR